jgi:hypothetical protein
VLVPPAQFNPSRRDETADHNDREEKEEAQRKKSRGSPIGSQGGVHIFTHKTGQFTNFEEMENYWRIFKKTKNGEER